MHVWSPGGTAMGTEIIAASQCNSRFDCTSDCWSNVGKSMIVEHVRWDAIVHDDSSMMLFFPEGSLRDEGLIELKENTIQVVNYC
jgi:hypothetical protein